jgi:peptide/nickel transport system permease protein
MSLRMVISGLILVVWLLLSLVGTALPLASDIIILPNILKPPDPYAWLGYDELGRAIFDRLIMGARLSLAVALAVAMSASLVGTAIGLVAGWWGGSGDFIITRLIDIFLAFPGMLLAIALAGVLGPGIENVILALTATGWVGFARLARAQTLTIKHREHILAARGIGVPTMDILLRHILPLIIAPLLVEVTFSIASAVMAEAGLSFLGLGVQPPAASWGSMIRDGTRYLLVAPHLVIAPGSALFLIVLSINLIGDSLRDRFDIKQDPR